MKTREIDADGLSGTGVYLEHVANEGPTVIVWSSYRRYHVIPVAFFQDVLDGKRQIEELDDPDSGCCYWRGIVNTIIRERFAGWVR